MACINLGLRALYFVKAEREMGRRSHTYTGIKAANAKEGKQDNINITK